MYYLFTFIHFWQIIFLDFIYIKMFLYWYYLLIFNMYLKIWFISDLNVDFQI